MLFVLITCLNIAYKIKDPSKKKKIGREKQFVSTLISFITLFKWSNRVFIQFLARDFTKLSLCNWILIQLYSFSQLNHSNFTLDAKYSVHDYILKKKEKKKMC